MVQPDLLVTCDRSQLRPYGHWVQQYRLESTGRYAPEVTLIEKGLVLSPTLPGLEVNLETLWPDF